MPNRYFITLLLSGLLVSSHIVSAQTVATDSSSAPKTVSVPAANRKCFLSLGLSLAVNAIYLKPSSQYPYNVPTVYPNRGFGVNLPVSIPVAPNCNIYTGLSFTLNTTTQTNGNSAITRDNLIYYSIPVFLDFHFGHQNVTFHVGPGIDIAAVEEYIHGDPSLVNYEGAFRPGYGIMFGMYDKLSNRLTFFSQAFILHHEQSIPSDPYGPYDIEPRLSVGMYYNFLKKSTTNPAPPTGATDSLAAFFRAARARADSAKHKWELCFHLGTSLPRGEYGVTEYYGPVNNNSVLGQATIGGHADFSGMYMIARNVGAVTRLGLDLNPTSNGQGNGKDTGPSYLVGQLLAGLSLYNKPINSRFTAYITGLAGAALLNNKTVYSYYDMSQVGNYYSSITPGYGYGPAGYLGAGVAWRLSDGHFFHITAGGMMAHLDFPNAVSSYNNSSFFGNATSGTSTTDTQMTVRTIQICLAISGQR
jgi:hypothetical protein